MVKSVRLPAFWLMAIVHGVRSQQYAVTSKLLGALVLHARRRPQAQGFVQLATSDQILAAFYVDDSYKLLSGGHA